MVHLRPAAERAPATAAVIGAICAALLLAPLSGCGAQAAPAAPTSAPTPATRLFVDADLATSKAAPVLGIVVDPGRRVLDVERGSSAEEIGIRAGDVVTKVGGAAVSTPADAKRSFRQAKEGDHLSVTVSRGGQELALSFVVRGVNHPGASLPLPTATPVPANDDYF